jgi:hypothetical protein
MIYPTRYISLRLYIYLSELQNQIFLIISVMVLSWDGYTAAYYGLQIGSFIIIYLFLLIFIPSELMEWILRTIFCLEDVDKKSDRTVTNTETETATSGTPSRCICEKVWNWSGKFFEQIRCKRNLTTTGNSTSTDNANCLKTFWDWCNRTCGHDKLDDKVWPHSGVVELSQKHDQLYCWLLKLNMNKIGVYFLLSTCVWCASIAFFEGVILGYATAGNGDICPVPKRGTAATEVYCFVYKNSFDPAPENRSFPVQCNRSMVVHIDGNWAGCFAWIYADVEVVDVLEELGICAGIIAFFGSTVAIISYLCRDHSWRLFFDILACLAIAAIPILIQDRGDVPFLTYILLGSLCISIIVTQYLRKCVPGSTWFCLGNRIFRCIKNEPNRIINR